MGQYTNFSVSHEHGAKLRELAKHHNKPASVLLTEWIDRGCREAGLGAIDGGAKLTWRKETGTFIVSIFDDAYVFEMKAATIKVLASSLLGAVHQGHSHLLDLDDVDVPFSVWRRGTGIRLDIEALARVPGQLTRQKVLLEKSMSVEMALRIANDLLAALPKQDAEAA